MLAGSLLSYRGANPKDLDAYVFDSAGNYVCFRNKSSDNGNMMLDHDDRFEPRIHTYKFQQLS